MSNDPKHADHVPVVVTAPSGEEQLTRIAQRLASDPRTQHLAGFYSLSSLAGPPPGTALN